MIKGHRFWTKDGVAVVLRPETEEQHERVLEMSRMWVLNGLGKCGPNYIVDFAEQHDIKYSYQMVV